MSTINRKTPHNLTTVHKIYLYVIRNEFLLALVLTLFLVFGGLFLGWENNKVVPTNPNQEVHYLVEPNNRLSFMSDWDGPIYLAIAKSGYTNISQTQFFPLYPVLIHEGSMVIDSPLVIALSISWLCLMLAIFFYIKIVKLLFDVTDNLEALRAVLLFVLFPSGVVLLATYTESLFAFLALGAVYFSLKRRVLPAAILAMFATATHIYGIFILALIVLILLEQHEKIYKVITTLALGAIGIASYTLFLAEKFNRPFAYISSEKSQGWLNSNYLSHLATSFNTIDLPVLLLLAISVFYWWKRKKSFSIYSLLFLLIPFIGGQFNGFVRYSLMAFPFELMLYEYFKKRKFAYALILVTFGIFWGYFLLQYAGGYSGAGG